MKITAFNASPRGKKSNTNFMIEAFLEGAAAAGAETEQVFLCKQEIHHCIGCLGCWIKTPGACVHKDDMPALLEKFSASDVVVMATPLYVDNVSGMMKVFMDRLIPLATPHFEKDENGETRHRPPRRQPPKFVVMSNCGFPEQSQFQVVSLLFKRIARNMPMDLIAEIYKGQGMILTVDSPMLKPFIDAYRAALVKAGGEIVRDLKISAQTQAQLDAPLLPIDVYISESNKYWDKMLAKIGK